MTAIYCASLGSTSENKVHCLFARRDATLIELGERTARTNYRMVPSALEIEQRTQKRARSAYLGSVELLVQALCAVVVLERIALLLLLEEMGEKMFVAARIEFGKAKVTFELSGRRRQATRPRLAKMYRVPPDRAWWPAVGSPPEKWVRPHSAWHRGDY